MHPITWVLSSHPKWHEVISIKKMLKGDSSWSVHKLILGWVVNTVRQMLELPAHRKVEVADIFACLACKERLSRKKNVTVHPVLTRHNALVIVIGDRSAMWLS